MAQNINPLLKKKENPCHLLLHTVKWKFIQILVERYIEYVINSNIKFFHILTRKLIFELSETSLIFSKFNVALAVFRLSLQFFEIKSQYNFGLSR